MPALKANPATIKTKSKQHLIVAKKLLMKIPPARHDPCSRHAPVTALMATPFISHSTSYEGCFKSSLSNPRARKIYWAKEMAFPAVFPKTIKTMPKIQVARNFGAR